MKHLLCVLRGHRINPSDINYRVNDKDEVIGYWWICSFCGRQVNRSKK